MRRLKSRVWLAVLSVVSVVVLGGFAGLPARAGSGAGGGLAGFPSLTGANGYVLSPASRDFPPSRVVSYSAVDDDYVAAGSESGHGLAASPGSSTTKVGTVAVRQAGDGVAGAWFSYGLAAGTGGPVS
ncbi:MAG: hypothetical protein J2P17_30235, partial [Mycobacterium sp.]|nr:hypothetical protein [Mycobacterium sp.]